MIPARTKIRVLVVDDSAVARNLITKGLSAQASIEVVGVAIHAADARQKVEQLNPDVMTLDVEMPGINGIEFLKEFLPKHPLPVILVSSLNLRVFDALAAGAVDFVRKPDGSESVESFIKQLSLKVLVASRAKVRNPLAPRTSSAASAAAPRPVAVPVVPKLNLSRGVVNDTIIALGASTGGTEATLEVLKRLPADIPGMLVVQHMPAGFTKMYADRINRICKMEVREAQHGDEIHPGLVLIAPAGLQMRVVRMGNRYTVSCTEEGKISGHCPSVDCLFSSMASAVKCHMVGIIMTGMGRDGANGLLEMRKMGAYTIGQDEESCVVYGMPRAAYENGSVMIQAGCENIASVLMTHLNTLK